MTGECPNGVHLLHYGPPLEPGGFGFGFDAVGESFSSGLFANGGIFVAPCDPLKDAVS